MATPFMVQKRPPSGVRWPFCRTGTLFGGFSLGYEEIPWVPNQKKEEEAFGEELVDLYTHQIPDVSPVSQTFGYFLRT